LKKVSQNGFTIVELLIVIVVIGILAALVLNSFSGVQARARNAERQSDLKAVAEQLEVFYIDHSYYPAFARISGASAPNWISNNMPGLSIDALTPPNQTAHTIKGNKNPAKDEYGYKVYIPGGVATNTNCTAAEEAKCQAFELYWRDELTDEVQLISSLHNEG
jgi:type IV pilus assembly protein PilA